MKKYRILASLLCLFSVVFLCACSQNSTQTFAKDLDTTVKNFMTVISTLDWPDDEDLESFDNLSSTTATQQTTSNIDTEDNQLDNTFVVSPDTQIDTTSVYTWLNNIHSKINILFSKRSDLLLYLNEIYGGNTDFSNENIVSLNVYMNILKDNSNYLSSYNGMLKNQINEAKQIYQQNSNVNLINAYIIKSVETLQLRCAKIDTSILAMTSIIDIIKNNLVNDYYSYNEHKIEETKDENEDNISNNEDIEQEENKQDFAGEETQQPITEIEQTEENDDVTEPDNAIKQEENAINFDGEIQQVENASDRKIIASDQSDNELDNQENNQVATDNQSKQNEEIDESKQSEKTQAKGQSNKNSIDNKKKTISNKSEQSASGEANANVSNINTNASDEANAGASDIDTDASGEAKTDTINVNELKDNYPKEVMRNIDLRDEQTDKKVVEYDNTNEKSDNQNINYDHLIKTLEEPPIFIEKDNDILKQGDNIKNNNHDKSNSRANLNNIEEIDKEFTYHETENAENDQVTREIIRESII